MLPSISGKQNDMGHGNRVARVNARPRKVVQSFAKSRKVVQSCTELRKGVQLSSKHRIE